MRRPHRSIIPLALALALGAALPAGSAAAGPAAAAALPRDATPLTVTAGNLFTWRTFERLNQVHWYKVALKKGQDYALWGANGGEDYPYGDPTVTVYGPTGKRLRSFSIGSVDEVSGREFRAPAAGTYHLKVVAGGDPAQSFPYTYSVGVAFDCREGPTTKCTLGVGQRANGFYNFYLDQDWRRVTLRAGRRYTLLLASDGDSLASSAQVVDRTGKVVGFCGAGGTTPRPCVSFEAAYSGPYHVNAYWSDEESRGYRFLLTSP